MNKKGFTLVELVVIIVLLSLIILVVASTTTNVLSSARSSSYERLLEEFRSAAESYASATSITSVYAQELIEQGYLNTELDGFIRDPRTNDILNCYEVHTEFARGSWHAVEVIPREFNNCAGRPQVPPTMLPIINHTTGSTSAQRIFTITCTPGDSVILASNLGFLSQQRDCPANGTVIFPPVAFTHSPTVFTVTLRNNASPVIRSRSITLH